MVSTAQYEMFLNEATLSTFNFQLGEVYPQDFPGGFVPMKLCSPGHETALKFYALADRTHNLGHPGGREGDDIVK